ncbi:vWA domain-containing protein [Flavitalea antarctica]
MIARHTSISKNIVQFCRFLRYRGFSINVDRELMVLDALRFIDFTNPMVFKSALKAVLTGSRKESEEFEHLFNEYWKELAKAIDSKVKHETKPVAKPATQAASYKALKSWLNGNQNKETEEMASYSVTEHLSRKDFSLVPADEIPELILSIKALSRRFAADLNRRYKKSDKVNRPDIRRTLRKNMRLGGELLSIAFKKPVRNRIRLLLVCDVSKSMELYSSFLLQFMFAFQQVFSRIETFAFSTSLHHISGILKQHDFAGTLHQLSSENNSWGGGTKIGESLHSLVTGYSRFLDKRTVVIILSDGWDTGQVPLLAKSMHLIHSRSKKVIWLNPLAGYRLFSPDTAGMQAAMPHVDVFAPVHNLASLKHLIKWL